MGASAGLRIGGLAKRAGTSAPTIRYYEEIGLLPLADRQASGQRIYGEADVRRLTFIRRCRDFGFSIEAVRSLVALADNRERPCSEARDIAGAHLAAVRSSINELRALERTLLGFVFRCDSSCAGGPAPDCVILEDLSSASTRSPRQQ